MSRKIWFKFYSGDYLLDSKIDNMPVEAQGIVVRIWCVLHQEGHISPEPEEISRKIRVPLQILQKHLQKVLQMFDKDVDGLLYSKRLDEEMERCERISIIRSRAVQVRHNKPLPTNDVTKAHTNTDTNVDTKNMVVRSQKSEVLKPQHAKRATRIDPDFQVNEEHRAFCRKFSYPSPENYRDEFVDYWTARAGQGGCKLDWDATFRNWIRNDVKRNGNGNGNGHAKLPLQRPSLLMKQALGIAND